MFLGGATGVPGFQNTGKIFY